MPPRRTTTRRRTSTRGGRTTVRYVRAGRRSRRKKTVVTKIAKHISREISGIFFLGFAVLNFLAIQGNAGAFGLFWSEKIIVPLLGLGSFIAPLGCLIIGLSLMLTERITFAGGRTFGILLLLLSSLGLVQLSAPISTLFESSAQFGGLLGFMSHFALYLMFGQSGAAVVLMITTLVSLLLIFNISLGELFGFVGDFFREGAREVEIPLKSSKQEPSSLRASADPNTDEFHLNIVRGQEEEQKKNQLKSRGKAEKEQEKSKEKAEKLNIKRTDDQSDLPLSGQKPTIDYSNYKLPPLDLLNYDPQQQAYNDDDLVKNAEVIRRKLEQFDIKVTMKDAHVGPRVVQYTLKPAEDVKLSKITGLKNDLALALSARAIRIEAPIPGKGLVGIEVPAQETSIVNLGSILSLPHFQDDPHPLKIALGRDVSGRPMIDHLGDMPHLLVAGQTGAGKSIGINCFILSLLYQYSPEDLRLLMVDPKHVELTNYNGIPHLLTPVITEPEKALQALKWTVSEMNRRYREFSRHGKRNITEYNHAFPENRIPYIVVIIDELADLMMAASKEIEATICRLAQMARATGVHIIIATQRPSVDVITGLIKANIPTRLAYTVATGVDSRTIIDGVGAEDLLGTGDMLYLPSGLAKPVRLQGSFVSTKEIAKVINFIKLNSPTGTQYDDSVTDDHSDVLVPGLKSNMPSPGIGSEEDDLERAIEAIREGRKASASFLQRRCSFGYAKAARILDQLEEMGLVGPSDGAKPRRIFISEENVPASVSPRE
ncbi:MAG: DNA translocase FtsK 4TM domain-containing protein [bacterium]|nr:DNA translocase FtsK 4TM domain-containing protein [bacterium]